MPDRKTNTPLIVVVSHSIFSLVGELVRSLFSFGNVAAWSLDSLSLPDDLEVLHPRYLRPIDAYFSYSLPIHLLRDLVSYSVFVIHPLNRFHHSALGETTKIVLLFVDATCSSQGATTEKNVEHLIFLVHALFVYPQAAWSGPDATQVTCTQRPTRLAQTNIWWFFNWRLLHGDHHKSKVKRDHRHKLH